MKVIITILYLHLHLVVVSQTITGTILSVEDGDSFRLLTPDSIYRIRLHGIDCPEINQSYGESGKAFLQEYTGDTVVILKKDIDKYGRTVAAVYYKDSFLNLSLIQQGLAWHYKKYSSDSTFAEAEMSARNNRIGIWSEETQIPPWDWRSGNFDYSLIQNDTTAKVFVCVGKEEMQFHNVHFCENLKACNSTIIVILAEEAIAVYRKAKCSICLN